MNEAMRVVSWVLMFTLLTVAMVDITTQLQEGVPWSELNWLLPICFGGLGTGVFMAELYGLFDTGMQDENYECDANENSSDNDAEEYGQSSEQI